MAVPTREALIAAAKRLVLQEYNEENGEILRQNEQIYARSIDGHVVGVQMLRMLAAGADVMPDPPKKPPAAGSPG